MDSQSDGLQLEKKSDVIGIDPCLLSSADEEFLIYSPKKCSYMFMSKDPSLSDKLHTKVEVRGNRDSKRNFFKLTKVEGKNAYYLYNVATEKFVYVSGESVLGVTGQPTEHEDVTKFELTFESIEGTGCYKIKNIANCFFVSNSSSGIPPNSVIHANADKHDETDIFQFVLEKNAKEVKIEFDLEKVERVSTLLEDIKIEYDNGSGEEEKVEEPAFKKEFPKIEEFKFDGFRYNGKYFGGYPARCTDTNCYVAVEDNIPLPTEPSDVPNKIDQSFKVRVSPGREATLNFKIEQVNFEAPFTVAVTTGNKKILKTNGLWKGSSHISGSSLVSQKSSENIKDITEEE